MLLGKDNYWTDFFLSLKSPETVICHHIATIQALQTHFGEPSPEQELFILNYCLFYIDRDPGSIESIQIINSQKIKEWYPYFKKKSKFSAVKYKLLALDFYRRSPLLKSTKQVISAVSLQIPTEDPMSYSRLLALKNKAKRIYLKRHLKLMKNRDRFLYNILDAKKEAELYLSVINAMDTL